MSSRVSCRRTNGACSPTVLSFASSRSRPRRGSKRRTSLRCRRARRGSCSCCGCSTPADRSCSRASRFCVRACGRVERARTPLRRVRSGFVPGRSRIGRVADRRCASGARDPRVRSTMRRRGPRSRRRTCRIPILFDSAHTFGAFRGDRAVGGFGAAEVFSLSPTKVVVAGEGGVVATRDGALAEALRIGRDYGNPGDYDTPIRRPQRAHVGVPCRDRTRIISGARGAVVDRRRIVDRYRNGIAELPGVAAQHVDAHDRSTYKDFTIAIDEAAFGLSRDLVVKATARRRNRHAQLLLASGAPAAVVSRCRSVCPPDHRLGGVTSCEPADLRLALRRAGRPDHRVLGALHRHADEVRAAVEA